MKDFGTFEQKRDVEKQLAKLRREAPEALVQ